MLCQNGSSSHWHLIPPCQGQAPHLLQNKSPSSEEGWQGDGVGGGTAGKDRWKQPLCIPKVVREEKAKVRTRAIPDFSYGLLAS